MAENNSGRMRWVPFYRDEGFRRWLWMTSAAFLVLIVGAFVVGLLFPALAESMANQFRQLVSDADIVRVDGHISVLGLFRHNVQAMLITILYGLIPALHLPVLLLGLNAILLGAMGAYYVNNGISLLVYLAGILPHGIFEIPAIVLALACGLYLCSYLTGRILHREDTPQQPVFMRIFRVFVLVITPLLAAAAVLEAYATPAILNVLR